MKGVLYLVNLVILIIFISGCKDKQEKVEVYNEVYNTSNDTVLTIQSAILGKWGCFQYIPSGWQRDTLFFSPPYKYSIDVGKDSVQYFIEDTLDRVLPYNFEYGIDSILLMNIGGIKYIVALSNDTLYLGHSYVDGSDYYYVRIQ